MRGLFLVVDIHGIVNKNATTLSLHSGLYEIYFRNISAVALFLLISKGIVFELFDSRLHCSYHQDNLKARLINLCKFRIYFKTILNKFFLEFFE